LTPDVRQMKFNSLDAQREACEAYIASQRGEGYDVSHTWGTGMEVGATAAEQATYDLFISYVRRDARLKVGRRTVDLVALFKQELENYARPKTLDGPPGSSSARTWTTSKSA
jgi:hypothetical protein